MNLSFDSVIAPSLVTFGCKCDCGELPAYRPLAPTLPLPCHRVTATMLDPSFALKEYQKILQSLLEDVWYFDSPGSSLGFGVACEV